MARETYVTLATSDDYCIGALVLGASLRQVQTTRELTVMVTVNVKEEWRQVLRKTYDNVIEVADIRNRFSFNHSPVEGLGSGADFTAIQCWTLVQFSKAVYLDADTMVLHNIDELFEREELSAVPDPSWPDCFNSGVFVFRPSLETFRSIAKMASEIGSFDGRIQGLLNTYFPDWMSHGSRRRLPYIYNCICRITDESVLEFYTSAPAWVRFGGSVRVAHFSGPIKPWHRPSAAKNCSATACIALLGSDPNRRSISRTSGMLAYWWSLFLVLVRPYLPSALLLKSVHSQSEGELMRSTPLQSSSLYVTLSDPTSYAPYRPSFTNYNEQGSTDSPFPLQQTLMPYHPEFHETRWDYLHQRQRIDLDDRFREEHKLPELELVFPQKPCFPPNVSLTFATASTPNTHPVEQRKLIPFSISQSRPAICLKTTPSVTPAHTQSFKSSTTNVTEQQNPPEPMIQQGANESQLTCGKFLDFSANIEPQFSADTVPVFSSATSPLPTSFSLDCPKCRRESAETSDRVDAVIKSLRREPTKPTTLRRIVRAEKKSRRVISHLSGEGAMLVDNRAALTEHSGRTRTSKSESISTVSQLSVNRKIVSNLAGPSRSKTAVTSVKHKAGWDYQKNASVTDIHQRNTNRILATGSVARAAKLSVAGIYEALDLAPNFMTILNDSLLIRGNVAEVNDKPNDVFTPSAAEQQLPSSSYVADGLRRIKSTPINLLSRENDLGDAADLHVPQSKLNCGRHVKQPTEPFLGSRPLLKRSRRRTIAELRKVRDKLHEHRFDAKAAASSWENKEQVNELCQILASSRPKKAAVAGYSEQLHLRNKLCARHERSELERMYAWERGEIDYTGVDRFSNILTKLCDTMAKAGGEANLPIGIDIKR